MKSSNFLRLICVNQTIDRSQDFVTVLQNVRLIGSFQQYFIAREGKLKISPAMSCTNELNDSSEYKGEYKRDYIF